MSWPLSAFADEAGPSCDEQIAALKKAGLRHIDIRSIDGHNITVLPLDVAKTIRAKLDAAGLTVGMYGSPLGKIDITEDMEIDLAKLRHLGELRPILGATDVRIFSYYNKTNKPKSEFQAESFKRLDELQSLAEELGLVLYHENESNIFGDKSDDVLDIAREFRDPEGSFRMIFDFGNYNAGGEDVWEAWLKLREFTDAIHIKDNMRNADGKLHHVPAGQGNGKIPQILADAMQRGWTGPLVVEPHLQHSAAVAATGPSGVANQAYTSMSAGETFGIACQAAVSAIKGAGAIPA